MSPSSRPEEISFRKLGKYFGFQSDPKSKSEVEVFLSPLGCKVPFTLKLSGGFWPSAEFGAGPALAPDQKSSWNGCQQAKVSVHESGSDQANHLNRKFISRKIGAMGDLVEVWTVQIVQM
jgi:hypothetical protein